MSVITERKFYTFNVKYADLCFCCSNIEMSDFVHDGSEVKPARQFLPDIYLRNLAASLKSWYTL